LKKLLDLIKLMRPHQWVKNSFVFTGLIFGHLWGDSDLVLKVIGAALGFSLVSSSVYTLNDILDRAADAAHPSKRNRPLAAGRVSVTAAATLGIVLMALGLGLGWWVSPAALAMLFGYGVLNIAYSVHLKHVVLIDVFIIATGFMLRILVGTVGVGIPPSQWLVLCGVMITLFLGFSKRRAEVLTLGDGHSAHRRVLEHYSPVLLDKMIGITASGVIMSYSLYTMSPDTIRVHHTANLIYTVPFVIFGVFRYIYLLHHQHKGTDTAHDIVRDAWLGGAVACWLAATLMLIS
jgi:4-hydroxybenzoate polyprenyltransferase